MNDVEKTKELYEAPAVLDINPVTVNGSGVGDPGNVDDTEIASTYP